MTLLLVDTADLPLLPVRRQTRLERALEIATEHCRWAMDDGQYPSAMLRGFGKHSSPRCTWDEAALRLALEWLDMGVSQ